MTACLVGLQTAQGDAARTLLDNTMILIEKRPIYILYDLLNSSDLIKRPDLSDCMFAVFGVVKNWVSLFIASEDKIKASLHR